MKRQQENGQDIESLLLELESDLEELKGGWFRRKRLPGDIDAIQLAEREDIDVSSARRLARDLAKTGKWEWLRVRDPRSSQGLMVLRKAENGKKADTTRGGKSKRR